MSVLEFSRRAILDTGGSTFHVPPWYLGFALNGLLMADHVWSIRPINFLVSTITVR
jgi:hypothetical protein